MTMLERQQQKKPVPQRLVFPPPASRARTAFGRTLRRLSAGGRGVGLPVGADRSVQCPQRGEIPVDVCAACPLLIRLKSRGEQTRVQCCVPREAFSAALNTSDRWLSGRMGFR